MSEEYRFAVIGSGGISKTHMDQIQSIPGARLVAVCDLVESRARAAAQERGLEWYTDHRELLSRSSADIVNIVTPSGTHANLIADAAAAGKHVIVEKPLDVTLASAQRAIDACAKAGVKLCVVSQHRFDSATQRVRQEIESGNFGKIVLGQASIHWYRHQSYYDRSSAAGTWAMDGGGVLMIQALHTIDIMQYLMGDIQEVYAHTSIATHTGIEVEDTAVIALKFKSGAVGTVSATTSAYPQLPTRLEVFGEWGTAAIEEHQLAHLYFRERSEVSAPRPNDVVNHARTAPPQTESSHRRQFIDMMEAIRMDREPLVNGPEALKPMRVILAAYESVATGQPVQVDTLK